MKTKLQQLEEKIRELCPELMELSFGCIVEFENIPFKKFICLGKSEDYYTYLYCKGDGERSQTFVSELDGCTNPKIIGHPIRLEHVLKAIGGLAGEYVVSKETIGISWTGTPYGIEMEFDYWNINEGETLTRWTLNKPLKDQPQETIDFLFDLLIGDE